MRISDWSSDVCSSDLGRAAHRPRRRRAPRRDAGGFAALGRPLPHFPHRDAPGGGVLGDGAEGGKVSALPSGSLRDAALAAAVALTGWQGLVWATGVPAFILPGPLDRKSTRLNSSH